ncbi:hypothetical protein M0804_001649 [Polistes exclamans]|nr:hypothetical protein M0804_001649 [Polistes exclamans]
MKGFERDGRSFRDTDALGQAAKSRACTISLTALGLRLKQKNTPDGEKTQGGQYYSFSHDTKTRTVGFYRLLAWDYLNNLQCIIVVWMIKSVSETKHASDKSLKEWTMEP